MGLDEHEVHTFHGWYRHITLSMVALAFLAVLRANEGQNALKKTSAAAPILSVRSSQRCSSFSAV